MGRVSSYKDGSYALVIGNSNYMMWDDLPGAVSDVDAVEQVLNAQGFKVETARDLGSRKLEERIGNFLKEHGTYK